jgi:hypothetical protein
MWLLWDAACSSMAAVWAVLFRFFVGRVYSGVSILLSTLGCGAQQCHGSYGPLAAAGMPGRGGLLCLLVAYNSTWHMSSSGDMGNMVHRCWDLPRMLQCAMVVSVS